MGIIPHNKGFVQVIPTLIGTFGTENMPFSPPKIPIMSRSLLESHVLFDQCLNVFPQPFGQKSGYPWRRSQTSRLLRNHPRESLATITQGDCNLAVMCGKTSGNLFILDCETSQTLSENMQQLQKRGVPLWVVKTARGGHIYLRSRMGEVHNIASGTLADMEIRGRSLYVLAPPSLHPSGVYYEWLLRQGDHIPEIDPALISWLRDTHGLPIRLKTTQPAPTRTMPFLSPYSALSRNTRDYMQHGHTIPEGTRNNRLFSAACDLLGNQYTTEEVSALLKPVALGSGLPVYEIEASLASAASQSRTPARPKSALPLPSPKGRQYRWQDALVAAVTYQWQGASASQHRALFLALVERARLSMNQRGVFRASIRELAVLARMSINTVQRVLRQFQEASPPLVLHVAQDHTSGANVWRFGDVLLNRAQTFLLHHPDFVIPSHWMHYSEALFDSDAIERGGIGKSAMYLYQFMKSLSRPMMPSTLAKISGLSLHQVNYGLSRLKQFSLLKRTKLGWCVCSMNVSELTAHIITQRPHLKDKGQRRCEKFAEERARFVTRNMLRVRLKREGAHYTNLLAQVLPTILSREDLDDDLLKLLSDKSVQQMLIQDGYAALADGTCLLYTAIN